ncbi:MAG: hypothetical protein WC738_01310 [Candidatus Omnitrophota bacterium]|jgi:hypothetical protein
MKICVALVGILTIVMAQTVWGAETPMHFNFENDTEGWAIPSWAQDQGDCVGKSVSVSSEQFSSGKASLKLTCDFPGNSWAAAVVEYEKNINLRGYRSIIADVYVPKNAPAGFLAAKIIVTAGGPSYWIEMRKAIPLNAGKWTTIKAPLEESPDGELKYWKCKTSDECVVSNLDKVSKIAIRIEYNAWASQAGPRYAGDVYIDNVTIE